MHLLQDIDYLAKNGEHEMGEKPPERLMRSARPSALGLEHERIAAQYSPGSSTEHGRI